MQKTKNKKSLLVRVFVFIMETVLIFNPLTSFAQTVSYDTDKNVVVDGNNISIAVKYNEDPNPAISHVFTYASYTEPHNDFLGNLVQATCQDTALNSDSLITSGTSPASGFCSAIAKCNNVSLPITNVVNCGVANNCQTVNECARAVADAYNNKIVDALQAATDSKISSAGLDKTKANDSLESCGGDLSCINNVLAALQEDNSFSESKNSTDPNAPLTVASLSDLINSTQASASTETGVINSSDNDVMGLLGKQQAPSVAVSFSSDGGMKEGSNMKAIATPGFFNNASDPEKLYFTWYLKRKNCEETGNVTSSNEICDEDSNGKIDENDWKISAAKIIIAKSFDREEVDYSSFLGGIDSESSGYEALPKIDEEKNDKNIGWRNGFLRDGNDDIYEDNGDSEDVPNCYVQAPKSGRMYEIRKTTTDFSNACPSGYHQACVQDQTASCGVNVSNPEYSQAAADAAATAVPPEIYSVPKNITQMQDFSACTVFSDDGSGNSVCSIKNDTDLKNFTGTLTCNNGRYAACVKNDSGGSIFSANTEFKDSLSQILGVIVGTKFGTTVGSDDSINNKICTAVAKPDPLNAGLFLPNTNRLISEADEKCSVVLDKLINGTKSSSGATLISGNANLSPKCTFKKAENLCKHLFPVLPKEIKNDDDKQAVTGDGEFNLAEKEFWGADPSKESTSGKGKDELRATGLGVNEFVWMYSAGDQVGVVVEGDSAYPSSHSDSSYQRTWAFSKGTCGILDDMEKGSTSGIDEDDPRENTRGFYVENVGFLTADVDLNKCLEENLLDPTIDSNAMLSIQLNSAPANPINDPNGRGDILTVSSLSTNTQNQSGLNYKWTVQKSRDGSTPPIDTTSWIDITTDLVGGSSIAQNDIQGLNKKDLTVNLNLTESIIEKGLLNDYDGQVFYLRFKVDVVGSAADGSQNAQGMLIVRVGQQQSELNVHQVAANNLGILTMGTDSDSEICDSTAERSTCYITKNEIVGLNVSNINTLSTGKQSNFIWTVNGNVMNCLDSVSSQCADGDKIFVPILGNIGEAVDVVAKGLSAKGEAIEVSRHFVIISPQVQIATLNESMAWPKLLGYYKDLNSNKYPDYSTQVLEANAGNEVVLGAAFYPQNKAGQAGFDWTIDGQTLSELHNQTQIKFPINKNSGDSYNIGLIATYAPGSDDQMNNIRKALLKNWSISPEDVIEQDESANIQLNVVDGSADIIANEKNSIFSASLITHLPQQLMFLLKISLTSILLLATASLLFAFMPETLFKKEETY